MRREGLRHQILLIDSGLILIRLNSQHVITAITLTIRLRFEVTLTQIRLLRLFLLLELKNTVQTLPVHVFILPFHVCSNGNLEVPAVSHEALRFHLGCNVGVLREDLRVQKLLGEGEALHRVYHLVQELGAPVVYHVMVANDEVFLKGF